MLSIALGYAKLPDVDQVPPLDDTDRACFSEIKEILKRYGKLERFGLALLHSHFPIYEGEMLVETCDPDNRSLQLNVLPISEVASSDIVETCWRLSDETATTSCVRACSVGQDGKHRSRHVQMR